MAKEIFRKVALERMSSPEQLDQMITITTPLGWLSLLAISGLLLLAILWGMYGSVPTKVKGQGIILRQGGVTSVQAAAAGKITKLNVGVGDVIQKGQIIARLGQDQLLDQIEKAQLQLKNLEISFQEKNKYGEEAASIQLKQINLDKMNLEQHIKNLELQVKAENVLKEQQQKLKEGFEKLEKEGIISKNKVLEAENEIVRIDQNISTLKLEVEKTKNQLNDLLLSAKDITNTKTFDELTQAQEIEQAKLEIRNLQNAFAKNSQVVSESSGRVLEVSVREGNLVSAGGTLLLIEEVTRGNELEAVLYFSSLTGKQIEKGMDAEIAPSIIKREEYGFIKGTVLAVDKYPSTLAMVIQTLQNQALAQMLSADSAPIKVVVDLIPDATTESGYKWSSSKGPSITMTSGTICSAEVIVKDQAPITLVIPILKKYLLGAESSL